MKKLHKDILKKLFEVRVTSRKTQKEIGDFVGVSHPMIGYWEKGKFQPSLSQFIDWCYSLQLIPELKKQNSEK